MVGIIEMVEKTREKLAIDIDETLARELATELESSLLSGQLYRRDLVALYRFLKTDLEDMGGCDHDVGICTCSLVRVLVKVAEKLGYTFNDGGATLPSSEEVR